MSLYQRYKMKQSAQFTRLVGVNYGAFQIILEKLILQITRFKAEKPIRQRGKKSSLLIEDQLLLTLIYLRQYHTFLQLGEMFSISESYAQKRYEFICSQLLKVLDVPNQKTLAKEDLTVLMDVTEQPLERPEKQQRLYYSGKKDAHRQNLVDCLFFDRLDSSRRLRTRQSPRFQTLQAKQNSLESKNNHQTRLRLSRDEEIVSES